ncbi:DUF6192 family protein [Streptomyces milbemycinicus]|uniref:DUF6192 family protein n=1 Tax=Streptomyces milbemycinicus TaxID=476552 RepID=UPI0033CCE9C1
MSCRSVTSRALPRPGRWSRRSRGPSSRWPTVTDQVSPQDKLRVVGEADPGRERRPAGHRRAAARRPAVAREAMRDDAARMLVNWAQFDNSEQVRDRIRERTPAVRKIEHTIEYLDLVFVDIALAVALGGTRWPDAELELVSKSPLSDVPKELWDIDKKYGTVNGARC